MRDDTIFALASAAGRAAVAVFRLSGPATAAALAALAGDLPPPRQASLRHLRGPASTPIDQAIVLWFPGPASYTGEDSAELHTHGGRAVIQAVADALLGLGLRPAEPGEFTQRGFLNGKLDLVQAEAIHDLVSAETEAQRRQALRQLEGGLGEQYRAWRNRLRNALARQEAVIDFPDEDLPDDVAPGVLAELHMVRAEIAAHLDDQHRGERLRDGLHFAITGAPNVGKSTLLNLLVGQEVAIVSPIAGTTRDLVEARLDLGGVPVTLVDTAGLRESAHPIEAEGIRRARARTEAADLAILVVQAGDPPPTTKLNERTLLVANKADLGGQGPAGALRVSARTGEGVATLRERLHQQAQELTQAAGPPPLTRERHRKALTEAVARLAAAEAVAVPELRGEELRLAVRAIGRIIGEVGTDELLDVLFREFCIGK